MSNFSLPVAPSKDMRDKTITKCPTCDRPVAWVEESIWRPFCSERCKLIDLGEWLDEKHRIPDNGTPNISDDNL